LLFTCLEFRRVLFRSQKRGEARLEAFLALVEPDRHRLLPHAPWRGRAGVDQAAPRSASRASIQSTDRASVAPPAKTSSIFPAGTIGRATCREAVVIYA